MNFLLSSILDPQEHLAAGGHLLQIGSNWTLQGHDVIFVHPGEKTQLSSVKELTSTKNNNRISRDLALARTVNHVLRSHPVDIVYHRFTKSSFLPLLASRRHHIPVVLEVNANLRGDLYYWQLHSPRLMAALTMERMNYLLADHIVVVAQGIADMIISNYGISTSSISVVENGVDLNTYRPYERDEACYKLDLNPQKRYVTFTGTFQTWQGMNEIIEAAALLHMRSPDIVFLLVGDGPLRSQLEATVQKLGLAEVVIFTDWQPSEQTALYLGASSLCLAPYNRQALADPNHRAEYGAKMKGSPLKIYNYLGAGRPVVATHFAEAGLLVEALNAGIAIPQDNSMALASAIDTLLANPMLCQKMGMNARTAAEENFGWGRVAEKLTNICTEVIARKN